MKFRGKQSIVSTKLTQARLREKLTYNPATGEFRYLANGRGYLKGTRAGSPRLDGYRIICVDYEPHLEHRLVWLYVYGHLPPYHIDHINGIKTDNRLANLRSATRSQNAANSKRRRDNTSGLKGVSYVKRDDNWLAQISIRGRQTRIGQFPTREEAHVAYLERARAEFNEFMRIV